MTRRQSDKAAKRWNDGGFTLSEVLISMAIFLVGFIAVASLFPAAAYLQKQTIDDINVEYFEDSVKALVSARRFLEPDLETLGSGSIDTDGNMYALNYVPGTDGAGNGTYIIGFGAGPADARGWSLRDRSFMSLQSDPATADLYWVPLVRDANTELDVHEWQVFAVILQRPSRGEFSLSFANAVNELDPITVPKLKSKPVQSVNTSTGEINFGPDGNYIPESGLFFFQIGDPVLDNNGFIYRVSAADRDKITVNSFIVEEPNNLTRVWHGQPGVSDASDASSARIVADTMRKIIVLTDAVETE